MTSPASGLRPSPAVTRASSVVTRASPAVTRATALPSSSRLLMSSCTAALHEADNAAARSVSAVDSPAGSQRPQKPPHSSHKSPVTQQAAAAAADISFETCQEPTMHASPLFPPRNAANELHTTWSATPTPTSHKRLTSHHQLPASVPRRRSLSPLIADNRQDSSALLAAVERTDSLALLNRLVDSAAEQGSLAQDAGPMVSTWNCAVAAAAQAGSHSPLPALQYNSAAVPAPVAATQGSSRTEAAFSQGLMHKQTQRTADSSPPAVARVTSMAVEQRQYGEAAAMINAGEQVSAAVTLMSASGFHARAAQVPTDLSSCTAATRVLENHSTSVPNKVQLILFLCLDSSPLGRTQVYYDQ